MLDYNYFSGKIKILSDCFGKIHDEKAALIYKSVKNLNPEQFGNVCDELIGNHKGQLTVNDFRNLASAYNWAVKTEPVPCNLCNGIGATSQEIVPGYTYAFRCSCKNGENHPNLAVKSSASIAHAKKECAKFIFTLAQKHQQKKQQDSPPPEGFKRPDFYQAAKDLLDKKVPLPDDWDDF